MENLKVSRGVIKGKVTRLQTYFDSIDTDNLDDNIISSLTVRLEKVECCFEEFENVQLQIEQQSQNSEGEVEEREAFENKFYPLVGSIRAVISNYNKLQDNLSVNTTRSEGNVSISHNNYNNFVKLPVIKLPTFEGQYSEFSQFKDAFTALVDKNEGLSSIQKFIYLRSALGKEALQVIDSIEVSSENYSVAWTILLERFENKKLLIHNHIKAIFEHPHIQKESFTELRSLFDSVTKHTRSLKSLGENTESWDRLLIYIMTNKFDSVTRRDWENHKCEGDLPTMIDLNEFLKNKCEILERLQCSKENKQRFSTQGNKKSYSSSLITVNNNELKCYYCTKNHSIYKCGDFLNLNISDRITAVKRLKLCLNCLSSKHLSWQCKNKNNCSTCRKHHNSLLHSNSYDNKNGSANQAGTSAVARDDATAGGNSQLGSTDKDKVDSVGWAPQNSLETVTINNHTIADSSRKPQASQVLLATALVNVKCGDNNYVRCRALLDSGSQSNFITDKVCNQLKLSVKKVNHLVKGVGQALANISNQANITIKSIHDSFKLNIDCLILPQITDKLPTVSFDKNMLRMPAGLNLADPDFNIQGEIDILLGSDVFWSILCTENRVLGTNMPVLQSTRLGWVIAGNVYLPNNYSNVLFSHHLVKSDGFIDDQIERFWQLEEVNNQKTLLSNSDKYCEDHFERTTHRDSDGRFIVNIPFKETIKNLGISRDMALNRFYSLESKLSKNPELRGQYVSFMREYKELNHMSEIITDNESDGYFLPHHAVIKNTSLTTKCRVVFDASAKTNTGLSLNDVQFSGPILNNDIFSILLRFRKYNYVITADVSKMYRQVLVERGQRKFQKIFWRENPDDELHCYKLNTITYGTASAPYLAVRCLVQLAIDIEASQPLISKIIKNDFYVDDLLTGANTVAEVLEIQGKISHVLLGAGFELRKWLCNDSTVLGKFSVKSDLNLGILQVGEDENNKTLGIYWNSRQDIIQYSISNFIERASCTKREILSILCQIYDPLGLLGPVIIIPKLIVQELWKIKISWDDNVPDNLLQQWHTFQMELLFLNDLKIPRQFMFSEYINIELHGFCDASERAYGACLYIRCILTDKTFTSNLVCGKSRVAPLKTISLPRLELCGAVLLAKLANKCVNSLEIEFSSKFFWTDSTVALAWIKGEPHRWKTFVANRVTEIQSLTNINDWYHVKSTDNPADLLSRGTTPSNLIKSKLWWQGPDWFFLDNSCWTLTEPYLFSIPEQRSVSNISVSTSSVINDLITNNSSLLRIKRTVAYIFRFYNNCRAKIEERKSGVLSPTELELSLNLLLKFVQAESFREEYHSLIGGKEISKRSKILSLNPFIHNCLIRVGGRLEHSKYSFEKRHPILLPHNHKLTILILEYEHKRLMHCGAQQLLYSIREQFWPVSGKNLCKKIIRNCITCFRVKPRGSDYIMGNLPAMRVNDCSPFSNVGVDYGGPFYLKDRSTRGAKIIKGYMCLFVCMSTKAVHLELVSDLTTKAFLAAFSRFVNRRGIPANVYSDNALNFIGANNEIKQLYEFLETNHDEIASQLSCQRINFHFIPANSPTFGGLWEAGIKSSKFHIKRVVGVSNLTFEHFNTVLVGVEAILNSRPLCPLTSDPNDTRALTPAHFLIGKSLTAMPNLDMTQIPENRLNIFNKLQALHQHFWSRWQKEYVSELQTRVKWKQNSQQMLQLGALVLVKNDNTPPLLWQLGRISKLYPGADGVIRVVDVKVSNGEIRRATNRLCVLPIETSNEENKA